MKLTFIKKNDIIEYMLIYEQLGKLKVSNLKSNNFEKFKNLENLENLKVLLKSISIILS